MVGGDGTGTGKLTLVSLLLPDPEEENPPVRIAIDADGGDFLDADGGDFLFAVVDDNADDDDDEEVPTFPLFLWFSSSCSDRAIARFISSRSASFSRTARSPPAPAEYIIR